MRRTTKVTSKELTIVLKFNVSGEHVDYSGHGAHGKKGRALHRADRRKNRRECQKLKRELDNRIDGID